MLESESRNGDVFHAICLIKCPFHITIKSLRSLLWRPPWIDFVTRIPSHSMSEFPDFLQRSRKEVNYSFLLVSSASSHNKQLINPVPYSADSPLSLSSHQPPQSLALWFYLIALGAIKLTAAAAEA